MLLQSQTPHPSTQPLIDSCKWIWTPNIKHAYFAGVTTPDGPTIVHIIIYHSNGKQTSTMDRVVCRPNTFVFDQLFCVGRVGLVLSGTRSIRHNNHNNDCIRYIQLCVKHVGILAAFACGPDGYSRRRHQTASDHVLHICVALTIIIIIIATIKSTLNHIPAHIHR